MGPSFVISGLFRGHLLPCWPSRSHLGSILRHFRLTTSEDRRCIADFAKFAFRLRDSAILSVLASSWNRLGAIFGPSWDVSGRCWLILGPLRATLGRLGPSRGEDRRRHSRFSKICTSPTRGHHSGVASKLQLGPFWGHLRPSRGHLVHIDHLGVIMGLYDVISVLRFLKTDDA